MIESLNYSKVINSLNVVIWEYIGDTHKINLSENYKKALGLNRDIETFDDLYSFIADEDVDYIRNFFTELIKNKVKEDFILEFVLVNFNKEKINIECSGKAHVKNNLFIINGVCLNTTEKVHQENLLRMSEKRYRRALEGSKDIMFYINLKDNIITLDDKISDIIGIPWRGECSFTVDKWLDFIIEEDREKYKSRFYKLLNNRYLNVEYRIKNNCGKILWLKIRGKRISEEDGDYIYGSINDDTDRKEKELKINYMSYFDDVTGIPNRRYLVENAEKMKEISLLNKKLFAFIFIDLDNFKYINDTYGHISGDSVLKSFCKKVNEKIKYKCFFARFGGDEFVISVENAESVDEVIEIVEDIIKECNIPMKINNNDIYNTVSIGISICSNRSESIHSLLKKADIAMYKAKSTGKNKYVVFNKELSEQMNREIQLNQYIRKSIENNEIYFLMQPKYRTSTNKIQGFEVLSRWNSKDLGIVSPNEFIPTAEDNGFIVEIGKVLIKYSFEKCRVLKDIIGDDFKIAVNLSEVQIRDESFVSFVRESLKSEGVDPKNIEFEVTESIIMTSQKNNINVLKELKKLGVSIALDDFGTGYSSLSYLRKLPIDTVKIDKSFIDDIGSNLKDECIIEKIVELSHLLELEVVAEGVENRRQLDFLRKIDCDIIQGYYFSKPLSFDEVLELIK